METKKNPKIDVNKKSNFFISLGLIIALVGTITAFQWRFYEDSAPADLNALATHFEPLIDVVLPNIATPPPPKTEITVANIKKEIGEIVETNKNTIITNNFLEEPNKNLVNPTSGVTLPVDTTSLSEETTDIIRIPEVQPAFPGGMEAFYTYLRKNLTYPLQAKRAEKEGKVYIQFVVDKNGNISEVTVLKGIGLGCDEAATKVIQNSPQWIAGKQRGKAVKSRMVIPIQFKLQ